ncbi:procyclic form-specific polypeptide B1-alpha-like isoform X2 [Rhincodon typus]|uniref:procyclic form-specific polypeptide B1-alpha-like isoform X2 n=1 Tax=Rhincodon typus TaxID=259920 RepID=UPI00202F98E1|nr:procyclic form-specific polypeptide B1-alpha-like isoform X2 [Rhincodon typus]
MGNMSHSKSFDKNCTTMIVNLHPGMNLSNELSQVKLLRSQRHSEGILPYRLRDREQLRKRKLENQEKKTSQEESKGKRRRKTKAKGPSNKHTKKPVAEPSPSPKPETAEEHKVETKNQPDPESERPAPPEESANPFIIEEIPVPATDMPGEAEPVDVETPVTQQFQIEHMPEGNAASEEAIVLSL